jgi:hypothetical protein
MLNPAKYLELLFSMGLCLEHTINYKFKFKVMDCTGENSSVAPYFGISLWLFSLTEKMESGSKISVKENKIIY